MNVVLNSHVRSYMRDDDMQQLIMFFVAGYTPERVRRWIVGLLDIPLTR